MYFKKIALSLTLIISVIYMNAQGNSLLYNNDMELRANTTLTLDSTQFLSWIGVEELLIDHILKEVGYSDLAREMTINEDVVFSFWVDSTGTVRDIKCSFENLGGLKELTENSLNEFNFIDTLQSNEDDKKHYYLPFKFSIINMNEEIRKSGIIRIQEDDFSIIQQ